MAFFDTFYLFSEVSGVVLTDGQPVADAVIEQSCSWGGKDFSNRTKTDAVGRFHFPEITAKQTFMTLFPHEPVVKQKITIHSNNKTYLAWMMWKHSYQRNYEIKELINGKYTPHPNNIVCETTNAEENLATRTGKEFIMPPYGICSLAEK